MDDSIAADDAAQNGGVLGGRTPTVFVTDAAAESARIADTLRRAGYAVVDVPLSMLVTRTEVQRPQVVLVDVDASNALEEVTRVRRLPGSGAIDFVHFGSGNGVVKNADDALTNGGSAFFLRPVDIGALVRRVEALTGGPVARPEARPSTPPPAMPARKGSVPPPPLPLPPSLPPERPSQAVLPGPGLRTPGPPLPMSTPSLADLVEQPRSLASFGSVSNELQQLLAEAELRVDVAPHDDARGPSPEEEIESVLPADVLASLDEPIEADEDEDSELRGTGAGPHDREGTGAHAKPTTAGGSRHTTATGRPISTNPQMLDRRPGSENPTSAGKRTTDVPIPPPPRQPARIEPIRIEPTRAESPRFESPRIASVATRTFEPARFDAPRSEPRPDVTTPARAFPSDAPRRGESATPPAAPRPPPDGEAGVVLLHAVDARRFIGDLIARQASGSICFEHDRVVRRLVIRDGDLVTAASGADRESLVCFLGARGDLPRDEVDRLAGKIPPYGRHAGAALVAHGWLGQDQLWPALRSHAEWIATCVLRLGAGIVQLETEPPGRLRSEPSVFGAATGAEIFVELVRRAVSPEDAITALGGDASRIGDGPRPSLLSECSLPPAEVELVTRARGGTLGELLTRAPDVEIASVVHGLALLGVLEVLAAPQVVITAKASDRAVDVESAALDDEAIRARVRARMELVDEGDYFSLLGVARDATSYEVRRAFIELRRAFEPTKILSPRLLDLSDDVKKIVLVLEEAYEILRDVARRERYRRAIDARP